jgi:hypothetical protein
VGVTFIANAQKTCREFECGWLLSPLPIEFRPDHVHIIIVGQDNDLAVQFVNVDADFPNAMKSPLGRMLIRAIRFGGFPDLVVTIGSRFEIISDNPNRVTFLKERLEIEG